MGAILQTNHYFVRLFGPGLPFNIADEIGQEPDKNLTGGLQFDASIEWAWCVLKNQIYIWKLFDQSEFDDQIYYKLTLPASPYHLTSQHILVFAQENLYVPSCIAMTPDGHVRFWKMASKPNLFTTLKIELKGELILAIHNIPPVRVLITTSSGALILIKISMSDGVPTIISHHVYADWHIRLGKKLANFFIDSDKPDCDKQKHIKLLKYKTVNDEWRVFHLQDFDLQIWNFYKDADKYKLIYECNIEDLIADTIHRHHKLSNKDLEEDINAQILLLDVNWSNNGIMVLLSISDRETKDLAIFNFPYADGQPISAGKVVCILSKRDVSVLVGDSGGMPLMFQLIKDNVLIFNTKVIIGLLLESQKIDGDIITVPGGLLNGCNMYRNCPVFSSFSFGLIMIVPFDMFHMFFPVRLAIPALESASESSTDGDSPDYSTIKSAYNFFSRGNKKMCREILMNAFPGPDIQKHRWLATALVSMSTNLINHAPLKDENLDYRSALCETAYKIAHLNIAMQLTAKQHTHDTFLAFVDYISTFLKEPDITRKFNGKSVWESINEDNEKLLAAFLLHSLAPLHSAIKVSIFKFLIDNQLMRPDYDSEENFFSRHISRVGEGMKALIDYTISSINETNYSFERGFQILTSTITVMKCVVGSIKSARDKTRDSLVNALPPMWLSAHGNLQVFDKLMALTYITSNFMEITSDKFQFKSFTQLLFSLVDVVIFLQLESQPSNFFDKLRDSLINLFYINFDTYPLAIRLAFKYKAFYHLIELAYLINEKSTINQYIVTFSEQGFLECYLKWLIDKNRFNEIFSINVPNQFFSELDDKLTPCEPMYWLIKLKQSDTTESAEQLARFGLTFDAKLSIKKKILLMVKYGDIASEKKSVYHDEIVRLITTIDLTQEISNMLHLNLEKPVDAKNLIRMLIYNEDATCPDITKYTMAYKVCTMLINPKDDMGIIMEYWVKAILKGKWFEGRQRYSITEPNSLSNIFFINLMKIIFFRDSMHLEVIPPLSYILSHREIIPILKFRGVKRIISHAFNSYCKVKLF